MRAQQNIPVQLVVLEYPSISAGVNFTPDIGYSNLRVKIAK